MFASPTDVAVLFEYLLILVGLVLLWRHVLSPLARTAAVSAPQLSPWELPAPDFLIFLFVIAAGGVLASFASGLVLSRFALPADTKTIFNSAAFQLGLLIGPAILPLKLGHHPLCPPLDRTTLRSGLVTFLIALPVVTAVNLAWLGFLKLTGLPAEQQDLLRMFAQADSPALLGLMIALATLIAPITEELLFRATFFRYLRTRAPRWFALLLPGTIFAALHINWSTLDGLASFLPLVTLAIVFSIAFERTGRIGTAIIAHALFNLHTVVLLLCGVTQ